MPLPSKLNNIQSTERANRFSTSTPPHQPSALWHTLRPSSFLYLYPQYYRCKLRKIGFDIVLCHSDTCPSPSRGGSDAKSHNIVTSLLTAEKNKFQRGKSRNSNSAITCKQTGITLSGAGDEIIGQLYHYHYHSNMQLIPFAISPLGLFGPIMNTFLWYRTHDPRHWTKIISSCLQHGQTLNLQCSPIQHPPPSKWNLANETP
jgi:hypothetical protein